MVRLITHNLLACHVKGCTSNNFPLEFKDVQLVPHESWGILRYRTKLPRCLDDDFLKTLHHVLLEIHVEEGIMICPNCKHNYPISNGIPNMLLAEHEIG
ncbi:hypothetical protein MVEN_02469400 [Mycena venus]|uniref:Trm112p-domain-containing protein n=1 Tax=Mycena venus TaxID=2733690 RepID=A0A8H7CCB5_9AGAR|nr:hypothetical protein MVEN_02469400 [Mycena venus]